MPLPVPLTAERIDTALRPRLRGRILTDEADLARYATDMSIYRIPPLAVVLPETLEDVLETLNFCREAGLPLTPRGGGSSTTGSALGRGVVLHFYRRGPLDYIEGLEEVNGEPRVTAGPAAVHDALQAFLRPYGLFLPSDPSSGGISLLGGNVATKASGPHAYRHGSIDRYLRHLQFVTVAGEVVDTADEATIPTRIRRGVQALCAEIRADEATCRRLDARKEMKLASGYNLFACLRDLPPGELVAQLLVGSVGTLGVITRVTLRAEPYIEGRATVLLYFRDLHQTGDAVQRIREEVDVAAIEMVNARALAIVRERFPDLDLPAGAAHMLLVEFAGPDREAQIARMEALLRSQPYELADLPRVAHGEEEQALLWKARKALFPVLRGYSPHLKALSLVNDVGVDPRHLADLILDLEGIFDRHGLVAAIYGHAGSGNLHLRPLFDVRNPDLPALLRRVADEVYRAVLRYDGTITAEHGMGRLRVPYLEWEWGPAIVGYMRRLKAILDPDDLLNPEVMFGDRDLTEDLGPL